MENEKKQEDTLEVDEATSSSDEGQEEDLSSQLEKERQARQQLTARAKKAEEEAKAYKEKLESMAQETPKEAPQASPDVDERILKSQGMADELLKELKAVSKVRGVGLIEAQNDPLFKVIKEQHEQEQKKAEASLEASKGSGQAQKKVDAKSPELSRDEHKKLWKEAMSK